MQFGMLERGHGSGKVTKFSATVDSFLRSVLVSGGVLVAKLCPTLVTPMDCSLLGSSVHGILQARILEWVAVSFSGGSSHQGIEPRSPALQADSLLTATREALLIS